MCLTERQSDEDEDGGGERGDRAWEVSWMRYRARRGEIETEKSSTRLSCTDISITAGAPCHSCGCVWFRRNKGILTKWCNAERPLVHLKLPSRLSDTPPFACNGRLGIYKLADGSFPLLSLPHAHTEHSHRGVTHMETTSITLRFGSEWAADWCLLKRNK